VLKPFLIHLCFLTLNVVLILPIGAAGVKGKVNRGKTHRKDMGKHEIERFLSHLAEKKNVAAATQKQALNALIFLYKRVLDIDLGNDIAPTRSNRGKIYQRYLHKRRSVT
jgi:hypothetical protein